MNIKQELELLIEKYKDKKFLTFEVNFVSMAKDCLREISRLERENLGLRQQNENLKRKDEAHYRAVYGGKE